LAFANLPINGIDAGGAHAHENLTLLWPLVRQIAQAQTWLP
jgi:hypothetical protein